MQIGFDFGDVIADQNLLKRYIFEKIFNLQVPEGMLDRELLVPGIMTEEQYSAAKQLIYNSPEYGVGKLHPIQGAIEHLRLLQEEGHEIEVISKRYGRAARLGKQWLKGKRNGLRKVPFNRAKPEKGETKVHVCNRSNLDIYMDNSLETLTQLTAVPHRVLFSRYGFIDVPEEITQVESWEQFYEKVRRTK